MSERRPHRRQGVGGTGRRRTGRRRGPLDEVVCPVDRRSSPVALIADLGELLADHGMVRVLPEHRVGDRLLDALVQVRNGLEQVLVPLVLHIDPSAEGRGDCLRSLRDQLDGQPLHVHQDIRGRTLQHRRVIGTLPSSTTTTPSGRRAKPRSLERTGHPCRWTPRRCRPESPQGPRRFACRLCGSAPPAAAGRR